MGKSITLEKRAKEVILSRMAELTEINTGDVMDLIRPHYQFDVAKAREQAIRRKAHSLMRQISGQISFQEFGW